MITTAPSTTHHLTVPGGTLAYDDTGGTGPLVVGVPGIGDLRSEYRHLRPLLVEAGYRVVTVDLRGHGESSTGWPEHTPEAVGDDVVALLRHLDAGPAVLLGESMAAASAVWAAAEAPELVSAIALLGPFARHVPPDAKTRLMVALVGRRTWPLAMGKLFGDRPPADLADHLAAVRANLAEPGRVAAVKAMFRASKAACEARMPEVRCPAVVVMGTADPDFPDPGAEARLVAERLDAEVVLVAGAGHYPHVEQPDVVAEAVRALLSTGDQDGDHGA